MNNDDATKMNGHERNYYSIQGMLTALDNVGAPAPQTTPVMETIAPTQAPAPAPQTPAPVAVQESARSSDIDAAIDRIERTIDDYRKRPLNANLSSDQKAQVVREIQDNLRAACDAYDSEWRTVRGRWSN